LHALEVFSIDNLLKLNRGIDAPESAMPYGKEAKIELTKMVQGKPLRVLVYGEDRYQRCVGDIYCNNIFVQVFISFILSSFNLTLHILLLSKFSHVDFFL
jgi:hypothetical protein